MSYQADNIMEFKVFFLDIIPHPAGLFTTGRSNCKFALQDTLAFIEQGQESAVEFQSLLGGNTDKNCMQNAVQLDSAEIGRVHLQVELV